MGTTKKVYLELDEFSISKILNGLKNLDDCGIKYSILEENPIQSQQPQLTIADTHYYNKKLGRHGLLILKLLYEGLTYQEIADKTEITIDGVRYYIKKIFNALNVNNSRDAIRVYITTIIGLQGSLN